MRFDLNGNYKLKYFDHGYSIEELFSEDFFPEGWLDTDVPEDVRTVLRRYGYIDGHYLEKELDSERWIDEKDWVYYKKFQVEPSFEQPTVRLCFDGIDTLSEVWLNGTLVGTTENMFLRHELDVTTILNYGGMNTLVVKILSPIKEIATISREGLYPEEDTDRLVIRKSQMNYGWDFCGHCLTTGIWKGVTLIGYQSALLKDPFFYTEKISKSEATIHFSTELDFLEYSNTENLSVDFKLYYDDTLITAETFDLENLDDNKIVIKNPKLWWPRPYGNPALYDVVITLVEENRVIDEYCQRFGIRTIELIQEKIPEGGRSFLFKVNGRNLFMRGANWVPINSVYSEIKEEDYDFYIDRAVESNLTMLRIWGGGIYEPDYFFDLCDEKGILVFQDFMLACGIFPQNEEFLSLVEKEVIEIAKKYRNRTSLAIWSADNELDQAYWWYDLEDIFQTNKVNRGAVQSGIDKADTHRPFLVSSPCSPFEDEAGGDDPNSPIQGDMHIYLTRFVKGNEYYYKKLLEFEPRFLSEYGFSSLPNKDSFDKFNFFNQELDLVRNPWLSHLGWLNKEPTIDKIIYFTQFTHAQGLKYWIEYLRACKWVCGGSLYWKFNDPIAPNRENMLFPSLMSSIDFFGLPKLSYYYAKRAYEDVILAFKEDTDGNLSIYGCSELLEDNYGTLTVQLKTYSGAILETNTYDTVILGDSSSILKKISAELFSGYEIESVYLRASFTTNNSDISLVNIFHLTDIEHWNTVSIPRTNVRVSVESTGEGYELSILADTFAQDIYLTVLDKHTYFSDNAFALEAGEMKKVLITHHDWESVNHRAVKIEAYNTDTRVFDLCKKQGPE